MMNGHLKDETIQDFALSPELLAESDKSHIVSCEHCQVRVANYRLLFTKLEQLPAPAFDFNLADLVLNHIAEQTFAHELQGQLTTAQSMAIEKPARQEKKLFWPWLVIVLMAAGLIGTPIYLFKESFQDIITSVSLMVTYLIVITVLLIAGLLVFDEYRKYNQRINSLDI